MANQLKEQAADAYTAFVNFKKEVMKDGAISAKGKELIAIAVSHALQCQFCIAQHTDNGRKIGLGEDEIAEAIMVAAEIRAGATLAYSHYAYKE